MKTKSTRITKRIWRLREDALRPRIVRMLHLGCTCPRSKKALGVNPQKVRDMINTELQQELPAFQRERLKILDRKMGHLLHAAVLALAKLLRHPDPWVRADAIEKVPARPPDRRRHRAYGVEGLTVDIRKRDTVHPRCPIERPAKSLN
jgi:hypothetical protein